jgi:hypothetical protein
MFEIEKILGSRGIADVVDGNRYDFQIFYGFLWFVIPAV